MTQQTTPRIEMDYARNAQAGDIRPHVVSVMILAAILALMVVLVAGSAQAAPCNPELNPNCQPVDPPEDPNPDPPDPSYDPVPGGFSWSMESRYPGPLFASVKDFSKDSFWHQPNFVQAQSGFKVFFNGCASDQDRSAPSGSTNFIYSWSFQGSEGSSPTTKEGRTCRRVEHSFMQEGSYEVKLTIKNAAGATLGTFPQIVAVKDKLIVAIGDSYGSGEGNPDKPQTYGTFYVTAGPQWADKRCHRSATAGSAQAARDLEYTDPHSSVTFVFLACSGAGIESGILGEYPGREYAEPWLKPQLDEVDRLVGNRQIDALVMSAGGNDAGFGDVIRMCVDPRDPTRWHCNEQGRLISERVEMLPERYAALNQRINDLRLNVAKNNVYLTEYPIGTRGNAYDGYCGSLTMSYFSDPLLSNMTLAETRYITEQMAEPLNQKMREAAQTHGWTYVGDINKEFSRPIGEDSHGFCANDPWVRTMLESNRLQGPESHKGEAYIDTDLWSPDGGTTGTMHPDAMGQDVYKRAILAAIGVPSPGPTFAASEPEYAPGKVVIRVTATDPSGIVSESVSVNATGACQVDGITCTARRPNGQSLEWTMEVTKEGLHTFDFRATDGDGQESSFVHEVENLPPAPPIVNGPTDNSYETDGSLTFFGTAEAGNTISLFEEGKQEPVGSATADGSGAWNLTLTGVAAGTHTYTAKATNISGLTSVASEPVRVSVDTQAPKVTSTVPAANATGIKRNTNLTATFSERMDSSTLTNSTFKLFKINTDGSTTQITNVSVTPSTDGLNATLNPFGTSTTLLAKSTKYKAIVTTGAKDVAGNLLDQNSTTSGNQQMVWSFKTGLQ